MRIQKVLAVALAIGFGSVQADVLTPTYDSFANLSAAELALINFGGTGLANAGPVALSTFASLATSPVSPTVYLAMSATPRVSGAFVGAAVGNDGAGTYFVQPGSSPAPGSNNAGWNFNYAIVGDTRGLTFQLFLDSNPGLATDVPQSPGSALLTAFAGSNQSTQGSQNLGFDSLGFHSFNPYAPGEYTFALRAYSGATLVDQVAIRVAVVPEPATSAMALAGLLVVAGVANTRRRKR
ncbi:MAG: PEP-CTERM sorting domain-containing protein [Rubrivivax sp.]|nr:PEP-CTERM sorting domain-containing protein [Rubrivivax sp.]